MGGDSTNAFSTDVGRKIAIDGNGNVYVSGEFYGSSDFGTTILSSVGGNRDGFVAKLNSAGTSVWTKSVGENGSFNSSPDLVVDSIGNVFVSVSFSGTVDFDPTTGTYSLTNAGTFKNAFRVRLRHA